MRAQLGYAMLAIGTAAAALGVATLGAGIRLHRPALLRLARRYVFVVLAASVGAFAVMEWALFAHDFSLAYVADNLARATPGLYTFSAAWSALEGSILLWALALSAFVGYTTWHFRTRADDPLVAWATLVQLVVLGFFFLLMLFPANPFRVIHGAIPSDGLGPNPLLQNNPLVVIHPPILYVGYVGFTIPFSFAVAALVTGRFGEGWLADVRRTTLIAFGFLTVGILLGAFWSYSVLGWGGYWGWDPVENASLLPWLTAAAFIHSVMVQERRGMLRVWNLSLVISTFCLTILGTFLTRSGVLNSVHAFSTSSIGPWLLTFLGLCTALGVGLIAWRGDQLRSPGRIDSPLSREAAFLLNNLLFGAFALVVLTGTVFPLLVQALQNKQITVGEPYFDKLGVPIGLALLFLMAVGPALPWRAANAETLRRRLLVPAWIGGITIVACVLGGARRRRRDRLRSRCLRVGQRRPFRDRRCARAAAGDRRVAPDCRAAYRAGKPAAVRRAARTRRCHRPRDGVGDDIGVHDQTGGAARAGTVDDGSRIYGHVPEHPNDRRRPEDVHRGQRGGPARHLGPRNVPSGDLDVPELP